MSKTTPSRRLTRIIALIVACAMFMAQLDASVVLVALPQMARTFSVQPVDLSIGVTIYILAQTVLLPGSSWTADRFGARRIFVLALLGFTAASILCAFSRSLPQFIGARVLQGAAAALMTPVARIMLLQATEKENLMEVITLSSVPMLIAPTVGPALGGFIVTYLSWPWIFLLNVPVGAAGIVLALRFIGHGEEPERRPFDVLGFLLVGSATAGAIFGLQQMGMSRPAWLLGGGLLCAGLICAALARDHLRRHAHPVFSIAGARIATYYVTTLGGGALVRLPIRAVPFIVPILLQVVLGYSALLSGLALLAMNGGDLVLKSVATRTMRRFGFRAVLIASAAVVTLSVAACAFIAALGSYWLIVAVLAVCGMARSLLFTGIGSLAFADVPRKELSSASALWNLTQQMTNALGVSGAALLLNGAALFLGESAGSISLRDCQIALLAMTLIGAASLPAFARLPRDAGAAVSGHRT